MRSGSNHTVNWSEPPHGRGTAVSGSESESRCDGTSDSGLEVEEAEHLSRFLLRSESYLRDGRKICPARKARGELLWVDLVETEQRWDHVCNGQNSVASYCEQWARSMFLFVLNFQLPNPHGDTVHPLAGDSLGNTASTPQAGTSKEKAYSLIVYFAMPPIHAMLQVCACFCVPSCYHSIHHCPPLLCICGLLHVALAGGF